VIARAIVVDGEVAGTIASWGDRDEREVTYWIGRSYWGKGIATVALNAFLTVDRSRPLHARVAYDNVASHRVLEKCGFRVIATERSFAQARSAEIEEFILRLEPLTQTTKTIRVRRRGADVDGRALGVE
jgi:RimJ/RimL family protein N-acetyltransferase